MLDDGSQEGKFHSAIRRRRTPNGRLARNGDTSWAISTHKSLSTCRQPRLRVWTAISGGQNNLAGYPEEPAPLDV